MEGRHKAADFANYFSEVVNVPCDDFLVRVHFDKRASHDALLVDWLAFAQSQAEVLFDGWRQQKVGVASDELKAVHGELVHARLGYVEFKPVDLHRLSEARLAELRLQKDLSV